MRWSGSISSTNPRWRWRATSPLCTGTRAARPALPPCPPRGTRPATCGTWRTPAWTTLGTGSSGTPWDRCLRSRPLPTRRLTPLRRRGEGMGFLDKAGLERLWGKVQAALSGFQTEVQVQAVVAAAVGDISALLDKINGEEVWWGLLQISSTSCWIPKPRSKTPWLQKGKR